MKNSDNVKEFLKNKKAVVIGLGRSGISSLKLLRNYCSNVTGIDNNSSYKLPAENTDLLSDKKITLYAGNDEIKIKSLFENTDLIIISPGVAPQAYIYKTALSLNTPIWSELELGWFFLNSQERERTIAVTGTNGKTTVTTLICSIFEHAGLNAVACGNIGHPLIDTVFIDDKDSLLKLYRIIEVSSFQLENIHTFKPHAAVILNITDDHLDRHESIDNYSRIKFRVFENQDANDFLILDFDDEQINSMMKEKKIINTLKPSVIRVSRDKKENLEFSYEDGIISYSFGKNNGSINIKDRKLAGIHNISNIISSAASAKVFKIKDESIENAVSDFNPIAHRLEFVCENNKRKCFNDSKATNPDAVIKALENFDKNVTIILGGLDKGMDFEKLVTPLNNKALNVILIGSCREKINSILTENIHDYEIYIEENFENAVIKAFEVTRENDVILLSPACASMDMFKDYKDRGDTFKKLVKNFKL